MTSKECCEETMAKLSSYQQENAQVKLELFGLKRKLQVLESKLLQADVLSRVLTLEAQMKQVSGARRPNLPNPPLVLEPNRMHWPKAVEEKHLDPNSWTHKLGSTLCEFCEWEAGRRGRQASPSHHWAFKFGDPREYCTACPACYDKIAFGREVQSAADHRV
jgi:hypothetical protein